MDLNRIEQRFFDDVLQVELDTPVNATLKVHEDEFHVVAIPQLSQGTYFVLRYFGTPAYPLQDENGSIPLTGQFFGVNPVMENAWDNQEVVELELCERPQAAFPFQPKTGPTIQARVQAVEPGHKGRLVADKNQITVEKSPLKQVMFSLVDFSVFKKFDNLPEMLTKQGNVRESLNTIRDEYPDATEVKIVRPPQITFHAKPEWTITITEDAEQTRGQISHSGLIKKPDDKEFEIEELSALLSALNNFFALVSYAYRHPTAIIGQNSQDKAVWGQIGKFDLMPRSTNWFNNDSNVAATVYLESLFPKFWTQWQQHPDELTSIIESHINSKAMFQAGLPKEAIAASYSGLDVLANLILTNPDPSDSVANVCKALNYYDIPHRRLKRSETPITAQLATRLGVGKSGPHVIYSVRNYVVHPLDPNTYAIKQQHLEQLDDSYSPYFYLHDLCQFYLEYLLLIGLCDWRPQHFRILAERR